MSAGHAFNVPDHEARAYFMNGADLANDLLDAMAHAHRPDYRLLSTGVHALDSMLTIAPGDAVAVVARPGQGKSTLAKAWAKVELRRIAMDRAEAVKYGRDVDDVRGGVVYVTLEEPPKKLAAQLSDVEGLPSWRQLRRAEFALDDEQRIRVARLAKEYRDLYVIRHPGLVDGRLIAPLSSERVMRTIEQIVADHAQRPTLVVLDYLQLLKAEGAQYSRASRTDHVMAASAGAVLLARSLNVPVLLAVQAGRNTDNNWPPLPDLWDMQWASSIEQDMDSVIGLCRPWTLGRTRREIGATGVCEIPLGDATVAVTPQNGRTMTILNVLKSRNDGAAGLQLALHVDPETLAIASAATEDRPSDPTALISFAEQSAGGR